MSYEEREGYGITKPRTIKTPDGTWNYYPKKGRAQPAEAPPAEMREPAYSGFDPYSEYGGGYMDPSQGSGDVGAGYDQGGNFNSGEGVADTGGIMGDVDIGGFLDAFDVNSPRRRRR